MAQLIITRPRLGPRWDIEQPLDVLIDGLPSAPIGLGETIAIDLPPGPHQASARLDSAGSQPILVESPAGETRRIALGTNVALSKLLSWSLILSMCPFFGLAVWVFIGTGSLLRQGGGAVSIHPSWHAVRMALLVPATLLALAPILSLSVFKQKHAFVLIEVPGPELSVHQIAKLLRERPLRVRITIRHLIIAVAISALCFWISLEVFRSTRAWQFQSQAGMHADLEDIFRGVSASKADYHAAMKRKYEQAAASRSFSVDPDPTAPP
jgi:hypothetical protein